MCVGFRLKMKITDKTSMSEYYAPQSIVNPDHFFKFRCIHYESQKLKALGLNSSGLKTFLSATSDQFRYTVYNFD